MNSRFDQYRKGLTTLLELVENKYGIRHEHYTTANVYQARLIETIRDIESYGTPPEGFLRALDSLNSFTIQALGASFNSLCGIGVDNPTIPLSDIDAYAWTDTANIQILQAEHLVNILNRPSGVDPIFLLGAGASQMSGISLLRPFIEKAIKLAYCNARGYHPESNVVRSDWYKWIQEQTWYVKDKPLESQYLSIIPKLIYPVSELRKFFEKVSHPQVDSNTGYIALLQLLAINKVSTVLTTNFDTALLELAKSVKKPRRLSVIKAGSNHYDLSTAPNPPQIVYLHGDAAFYSSNYFAGGFRKLDENLVKRLIPLLRDHPLVVVGYSGMEPAVLSHLLLENLKELQNCHNGVYWCIQKAEFTGRVPALVGRLATTLSHNFNLVLIENFDYLMDALVQVATSLVTNHTALKAEPKVSPTYDLQIVSNANLGDLNWSLVHEHLVRYCTHWEIPIPSIITQGWLEEQLQEQELLKSDGSQLRPTIACCLLFAHYPQNFLPSARIELRVSGNKPFSLTSNVWQQLKVIDMLESDFNKSFRLKGRISQDVTPYPPLALKELVVNALAHRQYDVAGDKPIFIEATETYLKVVSPGSLYEHVLNKLPSDKPLNETLGVEKPVTGYRNPVIADFLYASGDMDKLGSGLIDVRKLARQNNNSIGFYNYADHFEVIIYARPEQPISSPTNSGLANRPSINYVSNLLEITDLPDFVWHASTPYKEPNQIIQACSDNPPAFAFNRDGSIYSFSNLTHPDNPLFKIVGQLSCRAIPTEEFLNNPAKERKIVQLLNDSFRVYAQNKGLAFERKRLRAYFPREEEGQKAITYQARSRQATRTVVKTRSSSTTKQILYWEHQAVEVRFAKFGGAWGLHLVPTYIFTTDGYDAFLPQERNGPLATKRQSRDYNLHVNNHINFWAIYLSDNTQEIILESRFDAYICLNSSPVSLSIPNQDYNPSLDNGDSNQLVGEMEGDELLETDDDDFEVDADEEDLFEDEDAEDNS